MSENTLSRRKAQHRDRWSSFGALTGITWISAKPTPDELRGIGVLAGLDDELLESISPDVSLADWEAGAILFEEGSYLDVAFVVLDGEVEVFLAGLGGGEPEPSAVAAGGPAEPTEAPAAPSAATAPPGAATGPADVAGVDPLAATQSFRVEEIDPLAQTQRMYVGDIDPLSQTQRVEVEAAEAADSLPQTQRIPFLSTLDFDLPAGAAVRLGPGEVFGEIGALSGWPQSVTARTATPCRLLQIRLPALRVLKRSSPSFKDWVDTAYRARSLLVQLRRTPVLAGCSEPALRRLAREVELVSCTPDEVIVRQGEPAVALYVVRSGFVSLQQRVGAGEMVVSYLSKGMTLGEVELALAGVEQWQVTAVSVEYAELVRIPRQAVSRLLAEEPAVQEALWGAATERIAATGYSRHDVGHSELVRIALDRGLVQGTSVLVIDLDRCTRCDDCVRACAATHDGRPRFVREGGKVSNLLIARSCYHCLDPVCLVGCPTGAIHRAGVGAVVEIREEICIGCSTCANNCPYDAIVMHDTGDRWPADMVPETLRGRRRLLASKCDLCHTTGHGPACVANCPQGCASRVGSVDAFHAMLQEED